MDERADSPGEMPDSAAAPPSVVATTVGAATRPTPPAPPYGLLVFAGVLALTLLSFGTGLLLLSGATRMETTASVARASPTSAARASAAPRTASPAPASVRVLSAAGTAEALAGGTYRVTYVWALEGASEGDPALLRFFAGSRRLSELRGVLDQRVFSPATGRLTVVATQDCSTEGWSAELVSIRNEPIVGDGIAKVPPAACR